MAPLRIPILPLIAVFSSFFFLMLSSPSSGWNFHDGNNRAIMKLEYEFYPPPCNRIECPEYDLVDQGKGFEIRRYNSTVWMSTSAIDDISFVSATRKGFLQLFKYIQGKNKYGEKIEMTAPVLTEVSPSDGPFCSSSFTINCYVPAENQADPPPADGLHIQSRGLFYAAVRQFGGFVTDDNVGVEAAALKASLAGTTWLGEIGKSRSKMIGGGDDEKATSYTVAGYNSPFEFDNRVNEIWMLFHMNESSYAT